MQSAITVCLLVVLVLGHNFVHGRLELIARRALTCSHEGVALQGQPGVTSLVS